LGRKSGYRRQRVEGRGFREKEEEVKRSAALKSETETRGLSRRGGERAGDAANDRWRGGLV